MDRTKRHGRTNSHSYLHTAEREREKDRETLRKDGGQERENYAKKKKKREEEKRMDKERTRDVRMRGLERNQLESKGLKKKDAPRKNGLIEKKERRGRGDKWE